MNEDSGPAQTRWARVSHICGEALDYDHERRAALLDRACADDAALRGEVESLLACETEATTFLEAPALAIAAELLAGAPAADLAGRQVGPYASPCGSARAAMGEVYRARDTQTAARRRAQSPVADLSDDPDRVARFKREAQILASLNHPNIAAIYGLEACGTAFTALVLELVDGPTLADRIAHGPIPLDEALADRAADRGGARRRARAGNHSSRSETGEHQGRGRRHRQGARLRAGEGSTQPLRRDPWRRQVYRRFTGR